MIGLCKNKIRFVSFCIGVFLASAWGAFAYDIHYNIISSGEFDSPVTAIYAQDRGYIWVGTENGLSRIDKYQTRRYKASQDEATKHSSLAGNHIYGIYEDKEGRIWVSTDKGTSYYEPSSDSFLRFSNLSSATTPENNRIVYCMLITDDAVYGGGDNKIYKYSYTDHSVIVEKAFDSPKDFAIDKIFKGNNHDILLFDKEQGFLVYHTDSQTLEEPKFNVYDNHCAYIDSQKRLWRSQFNKGLECYNLISSEFTDYTTENSLLSSNLITDICEKDGEIWISTNGGGINIINPNTGDIRILKHGTHQVGYLPSNSIIRIASSANNGMWAASTNGTIIHLSDSHIRSFKVRPSGMLSEDVSEKVNCILKTSFSKLIWLGCNDSGLLSFNPDNESIINYTNTEGFNIVSMAEMPHGRILLSCLNKGLYIFDISSGDITQLELAEQSLEDWAKYKSMPIHLGNDQNGNIIILADKTYIYNCRRESLRHIEEDAAVGHYNYMVVGNSGGKYLICKHNLFRLDSRGLSVDLLMSAEDGQEFNCASMDNSGNIWIGTNTGILSFNSFTGEKKNFSSNFFNGVSSIICSENGNLWLGSGQTLFAFLPDSDSFVRFDAYDGANSNRYSPLACLNLDGSLFMGGSNGFTLIDYKQSFDNIDKPSFFIEDFMVDSQRVVISDIINVPNQHKRLQIRIFTEENNIFRGKLFRFLVKGPKGNLEFSSSEPVIQMSTNPRGIYTIFASCTLRNGKWSDYQQVATYSVESPWYLKWWSITLFFIFGLFSFMTLHQFNQTVSIQKHKNMISNEHVKFLLNVSHELKTPLTLIINPLNRIISDLDSKDANYKKLKRIQSQALRMKTLIITTLTAHKIEEYSMSLNYSIVDYNSWVKNIVYNFEDELLAHNIRLSYEFSPAVKNIKIDSLMLENVLSNILINALKHSPDKSHILVGTQILSDSGMIRVFVKDSGPGLGNIDINKLFDRYYQGINEKTGSGIGLAYSKTIVELHKGQIGACNNQDGPGATFYFDVPNTI